MAIYLTELDSNKLWFPSPYEALQDPNGLLAYGGDLSTDRLLLAYQNGIFPWYSEDDPILWWSPTPRAVFYPKTFKPSKSLKKFQRKYQYQVSINMATETVIDQCAFTRSADETWLTHEMRLAYKTLAKLGHCHSVEVWHNGMIVGGLYGVSIGQIFCGESMFSLKTNASKIALWYFCEHFSSMRGKLIDCQVMNKHLKSLGALELEREEFIQSLLSLKQEKLVASSFKPQWIKLSSKENP
ncbi:leucyl/phenylalanyl-tRNA--protein transferase [Vibrio zhanjiangensis]|uniref:Leucyl/phenylalanyl-tRNA--protein transferase n=1 Tax=Vibrio zhanjiangensis TaxID=1046128 RepID=A0ABQ6EWV8_9VIBR|nr:leucyl/phenylalanyl-tRNA--protein transferase [Vibrio zhanjiangensis]GLT17665.1 leucyl/phenylalanyl-tRNA--protein transferase [Vibrio zhanjiangensis]